MLNEDEVTDIITELQEEYSRPPDWVYGQCRAWMRALDKLKDARWLTAEVMRAAVAKACEESRSFPPTIGRIVGHLERPKAQRYTCLRDLGCVEGQIPLIVIQHVGGRVVETSYAARCDCGHASASIPTVEQTMAIVSRLPGYQRCFDVRRRAVGREVSERARAFLQDNGVRL